MDINAMNIHYLFSFLNDLLAELLVEFVILEYKHFALCLDQFQQSVCTLSTLLAHSSTDASRQYRHIDLTGRWVHGGLLQCLLV